MLNCAPVWTSGDHSPMLCRLDEAYEDVQSAMQASPMRMPSQWVCLEPSASSSSSLRPLAL
eukprot:6177146-Pleurochrysis_carterae.AAC.1